MHFIRKQKIRRYLQSYWPIKLAEIQHLYVHLSELICIYNLFKASEFAAIQESLAINIKKVIRMH